MQVAVWLSPASLGPAKGGAMRANVLIVPRPWQEDGNAWLLRESERASELVTGRFQSS